MHALDLTPAFNELLKKHEGRPTVKATFDPAQTEGFLKEAYRINGHIATLAQQLRDVRPAYLSTAPPRRVHRRTLADSAEKSAPLTDAQREDIDSNAKRLLRDLNASIRSLAEAETLHQETQQAILRKKMGGLSTLLLSGGAERAAAEEALRQAATHRESILWYLRQRLQACGRAQQTMMEARLARMVVETTASRKLAAAGLAGRTTTTASQPALDEEAAAGGTAAAQDHLTAEQVQMFEKGNQDMLQYYETTLDKVRSAEQSLVEISELQTMLVGNLEVQSAHVDQMAADSLNTAENVARGNQELKKALDRPSTARYTFYAASGLCLFVVVWDFFV